MKIRVCQTYETLSSAVANEILHCIIRKPNAVICLAAGESPLRSYELLVTLIKEWNVDYSKVHFIGLDEWVGIAPENTGSCQFFLKKNIIDPLDIKPEHAHLFNVMIGNINHECWKMDEVIGRLGGIDLMVVGIGLNGHIGFNEPGVSWNVKSHIVDLDKVTKEIGQKYFSAKTDLTKGITVGLKHLLEAKTTILLANGLKKAEIIKKALQEDMSENIPASIVQKHINSLVFLDEESASKLVQSKAEFDCNNSPR